MESKSTTNSPLKLQFPNLRIQSNKSDNITASSHDGNKSIQSFNTE